MQDFALLVFAPAGFHKGRPHVELAHGTGAGAIVSGVIGVASLEHDAHPELARGVHDAPESQALAVVATVCRVGGNIRVRKRVCLDGDHMSPRALEPLPFAFERLALRSAYEGRVQVNKVYIGRRQRADADCREEGAVHTAREPYSDTSE